MLCCCVCNVIGNYFYYCSWTCLSVNSVIMRAAQSYILCSMWNCMEMCLIHNLDVVCLTAHVFTKFSSLKSHIYRHHKEHRTSAKEFQAQMCDKTFKCHIDFCEVQCGTLTQFLSHLKSHIQSGLEIRCPFGCNRTFKVRSTFASHVSQTHKMCSVNQSIEPAMAYPKEGTEYLLIEADVSNIILIFNALKV